MLSKEECINAISNWENTRSNYSKIENLINPTATFNFSLEDCKWLNENNKNSRFHTYIGIHNEQLIIIVVPLNKKGKEIDLANYVTTALTALDRDLAFVETDIVTTTKKTVLSKNLEITSYCEEVQLPTFNEPEITERASVGDIEKWKNECLDWFYYECNDKKGKRIFKTFTVPFADLIKADKNYNEVKALFGFKYSLIYKRTIPILIFVATHTESSDAKIIRSSTLDSTSSMNTSDWSRPCPPMCRESTNFVLLK